MALQARITDVKAEDNGVAFSLKVEFYDDADPDTVLFTQPGESWTFDGGKGLDYAKQVIAEYGRNRLATLQAVAAIEPGETFAL